jgi:hypothetical protein
MLFTTSVTFEINKLQQIQNVSTMWFESMPGSQPFNSIAWKAIVVFCTDFVPLADGTRRTHRRY